MSDKPDNNQIDRSDLKKVTWGPKLFLGALVAILIFFYWLLIYSGGVTVHHG
ncbi:MAG: hypothetical protein GY703_10185 [Gammaproteobacteria bacterium]|nr:hypothetical protein [Gammaproteobacteria bacterium]